jgi:EamA domain-containing membrane protein RarD
MNIIVRVITGRIQDADNDSYDRVTIVYVVLAGCSVVVSILLSGLSWKTVDLGHLQWSRKKRIARGTELNERKEIFYGRDRAKNLRISLICFIVLILLVLGSWCAYFWAVATGNN